MKLWTVVLASALALAALDADAQRRLGGGRSMGKQSGNVTQREAAPPAPASPGAGPAQQSAAAQPARPGQAAPAAQGPSSRPWGAMLGGLAAGLGLAWLANSLGFGPALANVLLVALLALAVLAVVGLVMRSRRPAMAGGPAPWGPAPADLAREPRQYSPDKVGNDASARPWERSTMAFEAAKASPDGVQIGSALAGPQGWGVPEGFD
ncbi:MAG: Tim44 domain-containing protein, partial [Comamonadaceae bacterium]